MDDRCGILIVSIFLGKEWHTLSHMAGTYGTPLGGAKSPFIFQIPKKSKNTSFKFENGNAGAGRGGREREISYNFENSTVVGFNAIYIQRQKNSVVI